MRIIKKHFFSIVLMVVVLTSTVTYINGLAQKESYATIEIEPGDTLWNISKKYAELHNFSTQKFVEWVERENNIDEDQIFIGQSLLIPVNQTELQVLHENILAAK